MTGAISQIPPSEYDLAKQFYANASHPAVGRKKLRIEMGDGIQLRATWFDHDNLLAGAIVTQEDAIPLPDQRLGALRGSKWVDFQTREQACAALAKDAIQMVKKLGKVAQ